MEVIRTQDQQTLEPLQVSVAESAHLLGFCTRTVWSLIARNELVTTGRGKMRRVVFSSLKEYLHRHVNQ